MKPSKFTFITLCLVKIVLLVAIFAVTYQYLCLHADLIDPNRSSDRLFETWAYISCLSLFVVGIGICTYLGRILKCLYSVKGMLGIISEKKINF